MTLATWALLLTLFQTAPSPTPFADYAATLKAREAAAAQTQARPPASTATPDCAADGEASLAQFLCAADRYEAEADARDQSSARSSTIPPLALTPAELPPEALRDPHSYVLSQCSPLVLPSGADPALCEARVWAAIQVHRPDVGPRPRSAVVASSADDPLPPESRALGGRCRTVAARGEGAAGGTVVCGSNDRATEDLLGNLLRDP